jgi:Family of unknown function (DUF6492)
MASVALFCKSYREDALRARRLAQSVARFNVTRLPFFISVPAADLALFREICAGLYVEVLSDDHVTGFNRRIDRTAYENLAGRISQQIVKAEFWRCGYTDTYVCIDSDCYFLRDFGSDDFFAPDGNPYTVMHEAKELLQFGEISGMHKIARDRERECGEIKQLFGRMGRCWDFGPVPVIWSGRVWSDLEEQFLQPRGMTIIDAINAHPGELRWYGEALLAYRSIPLIPVEPLFRCYHYEEQYDFWQRRGETDEIIAKNYVGVCRQSNWDKDLDTVKRFKFSRLRRRVKRAITGSLGK